MLVACDIPEDSTQLADWLEQQLVGLQLGDLVAMLRAVHGDGDGPSLEDVCDGKLSEVVQHGLGRLEISQLQGLLVHPKRLLELQERVFLDGGDHWRTVPRTTEHLQAAAVGWALLPVRSSTLASPLSSSTLAASSPLNANENEDRTGRSAHPTSRSRGAWWMAGVVALVAALLLMFWTPPRADSLAWGWNRSGTFASDVTAEKYLDRLADRADEWSGRPHDTLDQLRRDLSDFRRACVTLLEAPHDRLPAPQRDELLKRCRKWRDKFDTQLAALEAGGNANDIRQEADKTVGSLVTALRQRFAS